MSSFPSLKILALASLDANTLPNFIEIPEDLRELIKHSISVSHEEIMVNDLIVKRKKKKVFVSNELKQLEFIVALIKYALEKNINEIYQFALNNCLNHLIPKSEPKQFNLSNIDIGKTHEYVLTYNMLRLMSGMSGISFNN